MYQTDAQMLNDSNSRRGMRRVIMSNITATGGDEVGGGSGGEVEWN